MQTARLMTLLPAITVLALEACLVKSLVWKCQVVWFWLKLTALLFQGQGYVKTPREKSLELEGKVSVYLRKKIKQCGELKKSST